MNNDFNFLGYDVQKINNNQFFCIYVLNLSKKLIFKIYKKYAEEDMYLLDNISCFEDISDRISFVIKRDGKISLDIKI